MSIADRLRGERERLSLNQEQLAAAAGVSARSVISWEQGAGGGPKASALASLAEVGVDVRYVITGSRDYVPPPPLTAEEQTLVAYYRAAEPAVRKAALGALLGANPRAVSSVVVHGNMGPSIHGGAKIRDQTVNVGVVKRRK